jgi:hypothetical protein
MLAVATDARSADSLATLRTDIERCAMTGMTSRSSS